MPWVTINGTHLLIDEEGGGQGSTVKEQIKDALAKRAAGAEAGAGVSAKGKASPIRGAMAEARREGKGKDARIVMADGSAAPSHITPAMVPPAWTGVKVSTDPKAEVLVTGRDEKGRIKMLTSKSYDARSAAIKFARTEEMLKQRDKIASEIQAARRDPKTREEADCAWLMQVQATRPGSDRDTLAKTKAYGATTLEARHVVVSGEGVRLKFIGKEGVEHDHLVRDKDLAAMLRERKDATSGQSERIFKTSDAKVRAFTLDRDGGRFTPKDFCTGAATKLALEHVQANPAPAKTEKEYTTRVKDVAVKVSGLLGNKPAEALKSYIHPAVFQAWRPT